MLNENRFLGTFRGHNTRTRMDGYFFWRGGWKILKKIGCKDKKVQINCLQT